MADILEIFLRAAVVVGFVILMARINGLRSFSKMSNFDFAITIATGSAIAAVLTAPDRSLANGLAAVAALFLVQAVISWARAGSRKVQDTLDNTPLLIMQDGEAIDANLAAANMTREDLMAKLREANALDLERVHAVVLETTGDVSVLHGGRGGDSPDPALLGGVRRSL